MCDMENPAEKAGDQSGDQYGDWSRGAADM
jgi:hypothetical protein